MKKLDRLKSIIAICILAVIVSSFVILGQDHTLTRYAAVGGIILWLVTMYAIDRMKKKK